MNKPVKRFPRELKFGEMPIWKNIPRFDPGRVQTTRWLIKSFLAERTIQLVYGERGGFKSTLLLFAAKAVAAGEPFLDMNTRMARVLVLDYENPTSVIKTRNNDFGLNLPHNENLVVWDRFGVQPAPKYDDPALEALVNNCVAETGRGPWIIFDSWSSLLKPGDGGEFTGQIAPLYLQLRKLVDAGATVTLLDHTKKYEKVLYGGQDKEAKADSIHKLVIYKDSSRPEATTVRVETWLKRMAPEGEGTFSFEVQSEQDRKEEWHVRDLVRTEDPEIEEVGRKVELLRGIILENPHAGQQRIAKLATEKGLGRDQASTLLKKGIGKHWNYQVLGHNRYRYTVI